MKAYICKIGFTNLKMFYDVEQALDFCVAHRAKIMEKVSKPMQSYLMHSEAFWLDETRITVEEVDIL